MADGHDCWDPREVGSNLCNGVSPRGKDEWNGIDWENMGNGWMSYPGRSPLADKGSGGVRAGAEVKRLI